MTSDFFGQMTDRKTLQKSHFLRDFGDFLDFLSTIFLYLMKSRLFLVDSDDPMNSLVYQKITLEFIYSIFNLVLTCI